MEFDLNIMIWYGIIYGIIIIIMYPHSWFISVVVDIAVVIITIVKIIFIINIYYHYWYHCNYCYHYHFCRYHYSVYFQTEYLRMQNKSYSKQYEIYYKFQQWYNEMDFLDRIQMGHTIEDMLFGCRFAYRDCSDRSVNKGQPKNVPNQSPLPYQQLIVSFESYPTLFYTGFMNQFNYVQGLLVLCLVKLWAHCGPTYFIPLYPSGLAQGHWDNPIFCRVSKWGLFSSHSNLLCDAWARAVSANSFLIWWLKQYVYVILLSTWYRKYDALGNF